MLFRRMPRIFAIVWLFGLGIAWADTAPSLWQIQWTDTHGNLIALDWKRSERWVWTKEEPVLELGLELPNDLRLAIPETPDLHLQLDAERVPPQSILNFKLHSSIAVFQLQNHSTSSLPEAAGFVVKSQRTEPVRLIHEDCARWGISLRLSKVDFPFLFVAVRCSTTPDRKLRLKFFPSTEAAASRMESESECATAHGASEVLISLTCLINPTSVNSGKLVLKRADADGETISEESEIEWQIDRVAEAPISAPKPKPPLLLVDSTQLNAFSWRPSILVGAGLTLLHNQETTHFGPRIHAELNHDIKLTPSFLQASAEASLLAPSWHSIDLSGGFGFDLLPRTESTIRAAISLGLDVLKLDGWWMGPWLALASQFPLGAERSMMIFTRIAPWHQSMDQSGQNLWHWRFGARMPLERRAISDQSWKIQLEYERTHSFNDDLNSGTISILRSF